MGQDRGRRGQNSDGLRDGDGARAEGERDRAPERRPRQLGRGDGAERGDRLQERRENMARSSTW